MRGSETPLSSFRRALQGGALLAAVLGLALGGVVAVWAAGSAAAAQEPAAEVPSPSPPTPEPPAASAPAPAPTPPAAGGVETIEKITFRTAVDRALAANTTVQEAAAEVLRAEALIRETRSTSLPQVTASGSYTRYQFETKVGPVVFQPKAITAGNGSISVPLVNLAAWAAWAHAIDNRTIAELSVADVKRRVALATANAYLTVWQRHRTIDANQVALETARAHFDIAHQRLAAGAASRLEEVQAGQDVSNDEVLVEQATLALRRAQEALGVLLSADGPFDTSDEPVFEGLAATGDALAEAEQRRADLRVLAMRETAAEHVLRDSWRDFAPTLGLNFQELVQNPATFTPPHYWQAQLLLTLPIYQGGLRLGERAERQALVQEARANLAGGRVQARSDVRIASEAIRLADQGLASARNAARQAHDALDIVNLSYRAGAATSLDVLDAQRRARDADTSVATAEDAARQARLDFLAGSGRFP